jgi:hypothetical protein
MRLEAKVQEGDRIDSVLVPLSTVLAYKAEFGHHLNEAIAERDFDEWEPWVTWHAHTKRNGETRDFDEWCDAIDWVGISNAPAEMDPFGGEADGSTPTSSPSSPPAPPADGTPSSRSTRTSKKASGGTSAANRPAAA